MGNLFSFIFLTFLSFCFIFFKTEKAIQGVEFENGTFSSGLKMGCIHQILLGKPLPVALVFWLLVARAGVLLLRRYMYTTREKPIHRILPAALFKIPRYCYLAAARVVKTRC